MARWHHVLGLTSFPLLTVLILHGGCAGPTALQRFEACRLGCDGGGIEDCACAGRAYLSGDVVPPDPGLAVQLLEGACSGGSLVGCGALGEALLGTPGIPREPERGQDLLERACDGGVLGSCGALGEALLWSHGLPRDVSGGAAWLRRGCPSEIRGTRVDGEACLQQGMILLTGEGGQVDVEGAWTSLRAACEQGEPRACDAQHMLQGLGAALVPRLAGDPAGARRRGLEAMEASCAQGRLDACYHLARLYTSYAEWGDEPQGLIRAHQLLQGACDAGHDASCLEWAGRLHIGYPWFGPDKDVPGAIEPDPVRSRALYLKMCLPEDAEAVFDRVIGGFLTGGFFGSRYAPGVWGCLWASRFLLVGAGGPQDIEQGLALWSRGQTLADRRWRRAVEQWRRYGHDTLTEKPAWLKRETPRDTARDIAKLGRGLVRKGPENEGAMERGVRLLELACLKGSPVAFDALSSLALTQDKRQDDEMSGPTGDSLREMALRCVERTCGGEHPDLCAAALPGYASQAVVSRPLIQKLLGELAKDCQGEKRSCRRLVESAFRVRNLKPMEGLLSDVDGAIEQALGRLGDLCVGGDVEACGWFLSQDAKLARENRLSLAGEGAIEAALGRLEKLCVGGDVEACVVLMAQAVRPAGKERPVPPDVDGFIVRVFAGVEAVCRKGEPSSCDRILGAAAQGSFFRHWPVGKIGETLQGLARGLLDRHRTACAAGDAARCEEGAKLRLSRDGLFTSDQEAEGELHKELCHGGAPTACLQLGETLENGTHRQQNMARIMAAYLRGCVDPPAGAERTVQQNCESVGSLTTDFLESGVAQKTGPSEWDWSFGPATPGDRARVREALSRICLERGEQCGALLDIWNVVAEQIGELVMDQEEGDGGGEPARVLPRLIEESQSLRATLIASCRRGWSEACAYRCWIGLDPSVEHRSGEGVLMYRELPPVFSVDVSAKGLEAVCGLEPELRTLARKSAVHTVMVAHTLRAQLQVRLPIPDQRPQDGEKLPDRTDLTKAHEVAVEACFARATTELEPPADHERARPWLKRACDGGKEEACAQVR